MRIKLSFLFRRVLAAGILSCVAAAGAGAVDHAMLIQAADADTGRTGIQLRVSQSLMDGVTFQFTVGSTPILPGGRISIQMPAYWSEPRLVDGPYMVPGNILVSNNGNSLLVSSTTGQVLTVKVSGAIPLAQEQTVSVYYHMPYTQYYTQDNVPFVVQVQESTGTALLSVPVTPRVDVIAGEPYSVTFDYSGTAGSLVVLKGAISSIPVTVRVIDNSWSTTRATAPVTVTLSGKVQTYDPATSMYSYVDDTTARFYSDAAGTVGINSVVIPAGSSTASFYYRTSADATNTIIRVSNSINAWNNSDYWVSVVQGGITNARVHKGDNTAATSVSIGPNENAYIDFTVGDSNASWQVMVATYTRASNGIWNYWGYGYPSQGQVSWNGTLNYWDQAANVGHWNERAPNGTYYVRIQMGNGGIVDDSLQVTVQSLEISGRVTDANGAGVPYAYISAYGPSYSYSSADAQGYYRLSGLVAGTYNITASRDGYAPVNRMNVAAGSTADFVLVRPAYLKVSAYRGLSANSSVVAQELWGGVQVYSSDTSGTYTSYWGSLHFDVNVSTSDNGQYSYSSTPRHLIDNTTPNSYDAGKWTYIAVSPGTYNIRGELQDYEAQTLDPVTVSAGQVLSVGPIVFPLKKMVSGGVALPAGYTPLDSFGTWVSIEAVPEGGTAGVAWGWTSIPVGASSGTYTIYGLSAGNYTLRTYSPGLKRSYVNVAVSAGEEVIQVPLMTLATGGVMSGTIAVEGDSTDPSLSLYGEDAGHFTVYVNAWSPDSYAYGWTQVSVPRGTNGTSAQFSMSGLDDGTYWVNSYINGYDLEGAIGSNGAKVTVSNGVGPAGMLLNFKRYSGKIRLACQVPDNDYGAVTVALMGGSFSNTNWQNGISLTSAAANGGAFDIATGVLTTPPLGTGFYQITATYAGTGLMKSKSAMVVNGQIRDIAVNLAARTYAVSGRVSIKGSLEGGYTNSNFDVLVDTIPRITVNGVSSNVEYSLAGTTTTFRVYAYDYLNTTKSNTTSGTASSSANTRSGVINANGTYRISGLTPGIYILTIPAIELNGQDDGKEIASIRQRVQVVDGDITGADLTVEKGYAVSGQLKLPSGETVTRSFQLNYFDAKKFKNDNYSSSSGGGSYLGYLQVNFYNTDSASYTIKGLAPGSYVLQVADWGYWDSVRQQQVARQYANSSVPVKVEASDVQQDIQLSKGGKITMKLRDAESGTVITPRNKSKMLPQAYLLTASANPWVEGGWASWTGMDTTAASSSSSLDNFELSFLPEASYDVSLGQSSYGDYKYASAGSSGGNTTSYAAKTLSSIKVKNGQAIDLGTIDIHQGLTVTGTVKDKAGNGIANIPVLALPSLTNTFDSELFGFTDINGKYSVVGLDPDNPYYDIIACPRVDASMFGDYVFFGAGGIMYGEKTTSMVKIRELSGGIDFTLEEAKGAVTGKVVTDDGGALQNFDDENIPTGNVFMQLEDTFPRTNPVGDIMADTELDGTFSIEALPAGVYKLMVMSAGYASSAREVTVTDRTVDVGTITMKRGARISGAITKKGEVTADGKPANPSTTEVRNIAAANEDFTEIITGTTIKSGEKTVTGYEVNGFQPGITYNVLFIADGDDMTPALSNYSVPYSTYVKTDYDLVYQVAAPAVFSRAKRSGNVYTIYMEVTTALRKTIPNDDDMTKIITVSTGTGRLSDLYLSPSRKTMSCVYTAPSGETSFVLRLHAFAKTFNPDTQTEYEVDESFKYYAGIGARNRVRISNMRGGKVTLEGDSSNIQFPSGTFDVTSSTVSLFVDFQRADSIDDLANAQSPAKGAPRSFSIPRPAASYPGDLHGAMEAAQAASVSPFSSFYDVMLPAGVSRIFKKDATLTLQYAQSVDPSTLNIYYYDQVNNVYLLENRNKKADTTAQTVSVSINHASIFVILQSNAAVIQGTAYNGPLFVYNYPNPFDLTAKSVSLTNAPAAQMNQSITGTMIHYGLPTDVAGDVEFRIYNVAGELVRTINDGSRTGGSHYYTEWDGKNEDGKKVASGVYIARFTVDKKNEKFFKMAVIK